MSERPILFSGAMVRAILKGRKTQTRRVAKHPLAQAAKRILTYKGNSEFDCVLDDETGGIILCPYGQPGDLLWVRETWHPSARLGTQYEVEYRADSSTRVVDAGYEGPTPKIDAAIGEDKWKPSIFMPRWASRLTLRITEIRVERVAEISEEDAIAEGLTRLTKDGGQTYKWGIPDRDGLPGNDDDGWHWKQWEQDPRQAYRYLWNSINGKKSGASFADNPFVWVVSFEREEAPNA